MKEIIEKTKKSRSLGFTCAFNNLLRRSFPQQSDCSTFIILIIIIIIINIIMLLGDYEGRLDCFVKGWTHLRSSVDPLLTHCFKGR